MSEIDATAPNDEPTVPDIPAPEMPAPDITVLYQDDDIVVASKPGGLLVHRTRESSDRVFLLQELGKLVDRHLYPVHRLDRAASGVIAFALSSECAKNLQQSLGADNAVKEYLALVRGETPATGVIDRPLTDHRVGVKKPAYTEFERVATFSRCSLLRVRIRTGRHRQIRRHLAHIAHQIIGCTQHGKGNINRFFRATYGLPRLFLHAARLEIDHPMREERLSITAPLASDLREFLLRLPDVDREFIDGL